ncbi:MAG: peptidylprolyl isomerase, partial [Sandaracinaceae bacterium]
AAFAIEQLGGYYPEVVETEDGFHIVKLTDRRAAMSRPLADTERPIRSRLFRERRETGIEALVTQLREEADVEENLDVLSEIHIELPQGNELTIPTPSSPFNPHIPADAVAPTPPPDAPETP